MTIRALPALVLRWTARLVVAGAFALGCGASPATTHGDHAGPDGATAAGGTRGIGPGADARGAGGASGAGGSPGGDAVDAGIDASTGGDDAAAGGVPDASVDVDDDGAADDPLTTAVDAGAGGPADGSAPSDDASPSSVDAAVDLPVAPPPGPGPCVLGTAAVGGCVLE
jgi:hypothetical protein